MSEVLLRTPKILPKIGIVLKRLRNCCSAALCCCWWLCLMGCSAVWCISPHICCSSVFLPALDHNLILTNHRPHWSQWVVKQEGSCRFLYSFSLHKFLFIFFPLIHIHPYTTNHNWCIKSIITYMNYVHLKQHRGGGQGGVLKFYTDDTPGIKM